MAFYIVLLGRPLGPIRTQVSSTGSGRAEQSRDRFGKEKGIWMAASGPQSDRMGGGRHHEGRVLTSTGTTFHVRSRA